jgi:hypothetical protein
VVESLRIAAPELANDPLLISLFGVEALREGRRQEAVAALDRIERMSRTQSVDPFMALSLCSALGGRAKLLDWLRRADRNARRSSSICRCSRNSSAWTRAWSQSSSDRAKAIDRSQRAHLLT